jgi:hypothetical protein
MFLPASDTAFIGFVRAGCYSHEAPSHSYYARSAAKRGVLVFVHGVFLAIIGRDPLVETVSKLLKKPATDWVLVEWDE